jgi:hypothetical protein
MKHINTYKLFESDEEDYDELVSKGFKYSNNFIKDRLNYLTDEGFIYNDDKKEYLVGENGEKGSSTWGRNRITLSEAHKAIVEFSLTMRINKEDTEYRRNGSNGVLYFIKYDNTMENIMEAIASFSDHFEDCKYNLTLTSGTWDVRFIISSDISGNIRDESYKEERRDGAIESMENTLRNYKEQIRNGTPAFNRTAYKNKVGESVWGYLGSEEEGLIIIPINTEGIRKQVLNQNMSRIESIVNRGSRFIGELNSCELREITKDDLERLVKINKDYNKRGLEYFTDRYLGLQGVIIDFDYDKWLSNKLKPIGYEDDED